MLRAGLGLPGPGISLASARRLFHLYLPVYFWILNQLKHRQTGQTPPADEAAAPHAALCLTWGSSGGASAGGPLVVGLSAPQGSGKTTIVQFLKQLAERAGIRTVVLSIDDFYLTNAEQQVRRRGGAVETTTRLTD